MLLTVPQYMSQFLLPAKYDKLRGGKCAKSIPVDVWSLAFLAWL